MSKSAMAKMVMPKKKSKGGKVMKKHAGGRLGRMGGAGLSPAEMARAGVMSEAQRRREAGKVLQL